MSRDQFRGGLETFFHNPLHFGVNVLRGRLAVIFCAHHVAAQEDVFLVFTVKHMAEFVAHAPVHDHGLGQRRGLLNIAGGAAGNVVGDVLLGDASGHRHDDRVNRLFPAHIQNIFLRQRHRDPERAATRNDRDLVQRMRMLEQDIHEGVTGFVPRRRAFFIVGHRHAAAFAAPADFVAGLFKLELADAFLVCARRKQRRFVQKIGEFRAGITGRAARDDGQIHSRRELHILRVNFQNAFATAHVRQIHRDLAIKTSGPQQRGIQHVRTVRRRDDDDALLRVEAVHLDEQRIQSLFTFVVAAAETVAARAADGINFINENQARRGLARLLKHVAHPARADADEHFHEVRTADAEECRVRFARDGFCQKGFSRAGRADHQHAFGNASAEALKFFRVFEKFDEFRNFLHRLFHAGHVFERGLVAILRKNLRLAFAEAQRAFASHFNLADEEEPEQHAQNQERRNTPDELRQHHVRRADGDLV